MKINVLVPAGSNLSGGKKIAAQYCGYLARRGHDVRVYSLPRGRWYDRLLALVPFPPKPNFEPFSDYDFGAPLAMSFRPPFRPRRAHLEDADVVIGTWWETVEWMGGLPESKGAKVHLVQDLETFSYLPQKRTHGIYAADYNKIVVSSWLRDAMSEQYGKSSWLVFNGVEAGPPPQDRFLREGITVGFMHSRSPRKNVNLAIAAVRAAKDRLPDLKIQVFGTAPHPSSLPAWVTYEQRPSQSRIREIYASCDAWLLTSTSEGFGLPILEAMATGTPVLSTPSGAAPELIVDGVNGRLLPSQADAFCNAITNLAALPVEERRAMARQARKTAERHSLERAERQFEKVLEEIVARSRS